MQCIRRCEGYLIHHYNSTVSLHLFAEEDSICIPNRPLRMFILAICIAIGLLWEQIGMLAEAYRNISNISEMYTA